LADAHRHADQRTSSFGQLDKEIIEVFGDTRGISKIHTNERNPNYRHRRLSRIKPIPFPTTIGPNEHDSRCVLFDLVFMIEGGQFPRTPENQVVIANEPFASIVFTDEL